MYELTIPQQNIWDLQKTYSDTSISNLCGAVFFDTHIERQIVEQALNKCIEHQSGMRLRFEESNEGVKQHIAEYSYTSFTFESFDSRESFDKYADAFARNPFEMTNSAMYRFIIFELNGEAGILACLNHMIADAWSMSLLAKGVTAYCKEIESGISSVHETHSYIDFVESEKSYLSSSRYEKDKAFWEKLYANKPDNTFIKLINKPTDLSADRYTTVLDSDISEKINRFCEDTGVSQAVLFETAVFIYLSRINPENTNATIGIPVLNRNTKNDKATSGMYISTTALSIDINSNDTAEMLMQKITQGHSSLFRHQRYPYSGIISYLRQKHKFEGRLFDVMVSFQNAKTDEDIKTKWYTNGYNEIPFTLHIDDRDSNGCYTLNADYQTSVFSGEEVIMLIDRFTYILEQITDNATAAVNSIEIIPEQEYKRLIFDFNDTAVDYPKDKCIHEMFEEQARKTPDKIALVFEDKEFTYKQLDEMSNSLAHYLRDEKGIKPNDIVPIIAKRSWHIIVAMLGVLKAGGAYMPVDPTYPSDRISYMIDTAKSKIALIHKYSEDLAIDIVDLSVFDYQRNISIINNINTSDNVCYVICTSGSTGIPKQVTLRHRNVANYADVNQKNIVFDKICREITSILSLTNIVFDIFVTESIFPLIHGIKIYFADDDEVASQTKLSELVKSNNIDVIQTTPTKLRSYMIEKDYLDYLPALKVIILGGEALTSDLYLELKKYTGAEIYNIYGPAETTVWSTNAHVESVDITIGKPIANTQIYILDKNRKPLPIGVTGELCISGDGVGKGYLNNPELTAEKFIPNPFIEGKTMYCTGDLARWRADGKIEYLGRIDTQVKIRGLRIELGEIESVMSGFDGVELCAVTDKRDENNRQYLVGYYTSRNELDEKALRKHLSSKLPKYMIPNYFMHLEAMPMTASGKIDRKNLPLPDFTQSQNEYVAPITETQKTLCELVGKLLNVEKVGITDDFFDLGGDSFIAITLLSKIEKCFDVQINMKDIIENSVMENLAERLSTANKAVIIAKTEKDRYRLLPQQKAIYAFCMKNPDSKTYNVPAKIVLPDSINKEKLIEALKNVFKLHKELSTRIIEENNELWGVYDNSTDIKVESFTESNYLDFVRPFDLNYSPLFRIGITEKSLLIDIHHIIADGTSAKIILDELIKAYDEEDIDTNAASFADYAEYYRNSDFTEHKQFYKEMLKCDFEPLVFPEKKVKTEPIGKSEVYEIGKDITQKVKKYASSHGLTETMLYMGAFGILLSKYTAKTDILTSMILTNRLHTEIQHTVGMFVNTIPVFIKTEGKTSDYFDLVKSILTGVYKYQELPFSEIADAVGMEDKNVINTSFVYQAQAEGTASLNLADGKAVIEPMYTDTSKFDISFEVSPTPNGAVLRIEYNQGKYENSLIDRLYYAYLSVLEQLNKDSIAEINVLSESEYQKVIFDFNDTAVDYPKDKCVHELFEEQARKTPYKVALVFEDKEFTYKQLDEMSNSLAHYLREEKGVKPNDIVPIIAKRSWHIIVAMLGVLKAGGAYMPVDPTYPSDRISYMIDTAKSKLALTFGYNDALSIEYVDLSAFDYQTNISSIENINSSDDLCYLIFTSGSTGKPKGVSIRHSNVANYCNNNNNNVCKKLIHDDYQSIVSVTNIVFDIFVTESILPLLNGITIYFANDEEVSSQVKLADLVKKNKIDVIQTTPTKMRSYMIEKDNLGYMSVLKVVILGGEALTSDLYLELERYTNAEIYNIYGPAETTVWSTNAHVESGDITIGKPIANTQIYILDKNRKPLPIGVAGELCISGDGVGKGYLNNPELTAEKFIPNPFIEGKTMYCTGDLARWRADGEIEYLGRIDTQVKIRGLRIELGEIESVMSGFDGVELCAVTDKRDENNRQYLVGYYTAEKTLDEKAIRKHLSAKLPKYMIPNYFMHLETMPMTASGKIDRKNLPLPDFTQSQNEYVAPITETQKTLCELVGKLLNVEKVGITDDFFDLGGDSLKAIEYVAKAHNQGIELELQSIFDNPTVQDLCEYLNNKDKVRVTYNADDFDRYNKLLQKNIINDKAYKKKSLGNVLLTGVTGFLGAHILDELMRSENGKIYCLVRSNNANDNRGRLKKYLNYYFGNKYDKELGVRIIPIVGNIETKGLSSNAPEDVQTVIHTAATVNHFGSYAYFKKVNVYGTRNVIEYAESVGAILIHISTISVSGNSMADTFDVYRSEDEVFFDEKCLYMEQPLDNVYIHSKFEAECAVLDAMLDGLNAKIIRVGNLTNRVSDMKFQPNFKENAFLKRMKATLEFGLVPDYLMPLYVEFSPIDETARGVVKIAQYAAEECVFHLGSNKEIYFDRLLEILSQIGVNINAVSGKEFNSKLQEYAKSEETEYIYEAFQNDMDSNGVLQYDSNIRIVKDFTIDFLKKTGFEWSDIDYNYIKGYVDYFRNIGFLNI